jgi:chloride channel 7
MMDEHEALSVLSQRGRRRQIAKLVPARPRPCDSHEYEPDESDVWWAHELAFHRADTGKYFKTDKRRALKRWGLSLIIGIVVGMVGAFVSWGVTLLVNWKLDIVNGHIEDAGGPSAASFFIFMFFNMAFVSVANLMVVFEPQALGSGVSDIKCFLNGINILNITRLRTPLTKVIGTIFAVSGGLAGGAEGPIVHSGAVMAAGISQSGKSRLFGTHSWYSRLMGDFRNDKEKRNFVACGTAAGVTAAFGAPIGGTLFSLEAGATSWDINLVWRCFFCAAITLLTLFVLWGAQLGFGHTDLSAVFTLGDFNTTGSASSAYGNADLIMISVLGAICGVVGGSFNWFNKQLTIFRLYFVQSPLSMYIEAICVAVLVSVIPYGLSAIWECRPLPVETDAWTDQQNELVSTLLPFNCVQGKEYNEVASLYMNSAEKAMRLLLHLEVSPPDTVEAFSSPALVVFLLPYLVLACLTYGIAVPSGILAPGLLSGAAIGRIFGIIVREMYGETSAVGGAFATAGTYAFIGAAGLLGGITRLTISLAVIMVEATGDMSYGLPLMFVLMFARWFGNIVGMGLYDVHIHLQGRPFLDGALPVAARDSNGCALDMAGKPVLSLRPFERAGAIYDLLMRTEHHSFPVQDSHMNDALLGTISRKVLSIVLYKKAFGPIGGTVDDAAHNSPIVSWETMEAMYPKFVNVHTDVHLDRQDLSRWVDLRPYINNATYTINETASLERVYHFFFSMGLRHLTVVDAANHPVGMVSRIDLVALGAGEEALAKP